MQTERLSETRRKVLDMTQRGATVREIALVLGISTQVVYRHLDRLRSAGFLPQKDDAA